MGRGAPGPPPPPPHPHPHTSPTHLTSTPTSRSHPPTHMAPLTPRAVAARQHQALSQVLQAGGEGGGVQPGGVPLRAGLLLAVWAGHWAGAHLDEHRGARAGVCGWVDLGGARLLCLRAWLSTNPTHPHPHPPTHPSTHPSRVTPVVPTRTRQRLAPRQQSGERRAALLGTPPACLPACLPDCLPGLLACLPAPPPACLPPCLPAPPLVCTHPPTHPPPCTATSITSPTHLTLPSPPPHTHTARLSATSIT